MGVSRTIQILEVPLLSQERVKLRISNFVGLRTFIGWIGTKAQNFEKNFEKVTMSAVRESRKFSGHPGRIVRSSLRIAQLSCLVIEGGETVENTSVYGMA